MRHLTISQLTLHTASLFRQFSTSKSLAIMNFFSLSGGIKMSADSETAYPKLNRTGINTNPKRNYPKIKGHEKVRILLAEDSKINTSLIRSLLAAERFEIDSAENGKKAVELLERNHYTMILMDLMMPIMNGFEATLYIRNEMNSPKSNIPIIALVADMTKVIAVKCSKTGMNDYITKPFNENELITKINRYQNR